MIIEWENNEYNIDVHTMDISIRALLIFPIYFLLNYNFSTHYSEVNSCPTFIIFELTQAELKAVILYNFNIVL
jgi:hypothetical protein